MRATVSSTSPDEGQPFWIDTSGSSDADGDTLTITVTQVSGPAPSDVPIYEDIPSGDGIFAFRAPELDEDAVMAFEVSVSDGEDTRTETVNVTVQNIALEPEANILGRVHRVFDGLNKPAEVGLYSYWGHAFGTPKVFAQQDITTGIIGVMNSEDGNRKVLFRYPSDNQVDEFGEIDTTHLPYITIGDSASLTTMLAYSSYNFGVTPIVWSESADRLYVLSRNALDRMYMNVSNIYDVESPCAVSYIRNGHGYNFDMVVAKRGGGLQVFPQLPEWPLEYGDGTFEPGIVLADAGTFCSIYTTGLEVAAYDFERSEIRVWKSESNQSYVYTEVASLPIDLPETDLKLVDVEILYSYVGFDQGFIAALLYSDGQHDGRHELHVYSNGYRGGEPTVSKVFTWEKGRPVEVKYIHHVDGTEQEGLAVVLETAPYMIWIPDNGTRYSSDLYPAFEELFYVPTGLWLTSIQEGIAGNFGRYSLTLTYTMLGKAVLHGVIDISGTP